MKLAVLYIFKAERLKEEIPESRGSEEEPRHLRTETNDAEDFEGSSWQVISTPTSPDQT